MSNSWNENLAIWGACLTLGCVWYSPKNIFLRFDILTSTKLSELSRRRQTAEASSHNRKITIQKLYNVAGTGIATSTAYMVPIHSMVLVLIDRVQVIGEDKRPANTRYVPHGIVSMKQLHLVSF